MQKTALLVDGSSAMNSSADYLPSRLLALRSCVNQFIRTHLDTNPLATISAIVMRDTVAHKVMGLTNSAPQLLEALEVKYFLQGGSGAMSLEAGLRAAFSDLVDLKKTKIPVSCRVVLLTASVTMVDGSDVMEQLVPLLHRAGIQVDVVHLVGTVHVLSQLTHATSGSYHCPLNFEHMQSIMRRLGLSAVASSTVKTSVSHSRSSAAIPIGFPEECESAEKPGHSYLVCPRCKLPQATVPGVCRLCGLLVASLPFIHTNFIWKNQLVPPPSPSPVSAADAGGGVRCAVCDDVVECSGGIRCSGCEQVRCRECDDHVHFTLGICPSCIA